ncbi:hypothetical protein QC763_101828 [Podospora pseudopauciseta]|uniref:Uncharacterized protein n=1 Tax=Podospora pseudopauciseta TaxID=2093780 RepID=A0ABR0HW15_9PEZI|nr:hypothetical protein QC763_101828 [Podospora pseudopauciseta]
MCLLGHCGWERRDVGETARDVFQLCGDACSKSSSLGRSSRNPLGHTSRTMGGNKKVRRR